MKAKLIILYIFTLFSLETLSQSLETPTYSFLKLKADTITFYGESQTQFKAFTKKFSQMVRLGNRQINILHLGDSHLQADLYTGQVRKNFQSFMAGLEGTRGMITPFLKGSPDSYKIKFSPDWHSINILSSSNHSHLGLWGTTAYTNSLNSTINVNVNNKNPVKYDFNRMRLYHSALTDKDNIVINDINIAYQKVINEDAGYTEFVFADYLQDINITISKSSNDTFYLYGLYFSNDDAGVVYNVTGTNGATALSYINADKFSSQLATINTDLIIISLGTNDTYEPGGENTFENNLTTLVKNIRQTKPLNPILLITPVECYHHRRTINPRQTKTVEIINRVAEQNGCMYLDMYQVMGGKNSCNQLLRNSLMQKDRVHLTAKGYQLEGDLLYNALWDALEKNF